MHWWKSSGDAKAEEQLKRILARRGHTWRDFGVEGADGGNEMIALKRRAIAGAPPAAALFKGPAIQEWTSLVV